jgi:chemotaxis protein methyltransferase CheR
MSTAGLAIQLSGSELKMLQTLVYQECGMYFDERRMDFLQNRLQGRLKECRAESFYSYYRLLVSPGGRQELARLLEDLTVNETSFFRNLPQLELFHKHILTEILRKKQEQANHTLRIWSAGCSTGQEPYTLAMLVADALAYYALRHPSTLAAGLPRKLVPLPWNVEILASDVNYTVLRAGQEGMYAEHHMTPVDYSYRLRYFDKVGDRYAIKQSVKELVHFDFHNLKTQFLPQDNDVIFCRNVMMYFDQAEQIRLVEKFRRCLNPDGYIFLGHAESLRGLSDRFAMLHRNHGTAYQRLEEAQ